MDRQRSPGAEREGEGGTEGQREGWKDWEAGREERERYREREACPSTFNIFFKMTANKPMVQIKWIK